MTIENAYNLLSSHSSSYSNPAASGQEPLLMKPKKMRWKPGLELPVAMEPSLQVPVVSRLAWAASCALIVFVGMVLGAVVSHVAMEMISWVAKAKVGVLPNPFGKANDFPIGEMIRLDVSGRGLWVYKPTRTAGQEQLPLVLVLHGSLDNATNIAQVSRMAEVAERAPKSFLVAFPEMVIERSMSWDFGQPHEVKFFRDSVKLLDSKKLIRRDEVFVCGHSSGGTMALFLQNNLPDIFQGAAAVEAGVGHMDAWINSSVGSPTMVIWNHNDQVLDEFGGEKLYNTTLEVLRRHDPEGATPASVTQVDTGDGDVEFAQRLLWRATPEGQPPLMVISWRSRAPSHEWLNPTNFEGATLDAGELIWKFFSATALLEEHNELRRSRAAA